MRRKSAAFNLAEQRALFDETCAADVEAQLAALQPAAKGSTAPEQQARRQPMREAPPAHLPRVDQRVEPEDTHFPTPECGQPMVRVVEPRAESAVGSANAPAHAHAASLSKPLKTSGIASLQSMLTKLSSAARV